MSDLPQQNTIVQYVADGISTDFTVPFYTPIESDGSPDLAVYVQAANATPIPSNDIQEWNVDYIYIPDTPDPITGGKVRFLTGHIPPNTYIVTIARDVSASLNVDFSAAQNFSGITLDNALDKLLLITQQNKTYANDRNLSYIINSYLPLSTSLSNIQIPVLQPGYIWIGSSGGVISAFLEQPADVSTLRSELANDAPGTDGARLVGYYDSVNSSATTVDAQLTYLTSSVVAPFPTGVIVDFGGTSAPAGFLVCDGSDVSRATYSDLFAVIGIVWGAGNGTTTFNLPDFSRRTAVGSGGAGTGTLGNAVGNTGGEETHLQAENEMFRHDHPGSTASSTNAHIANSTGGNLERFVASGQTNQGTLTISSNVTVNPQGGTTPMNIIQPSAVTLKIIKT